MSQCQFIESRLSEDCGCPEQDWVINGIYTTIHLEEDGGGHILLTDDGGDGPEKLTPCDGIGDLLEKAKDWIATLTIEGE
jgi:hypothetical protein